MLSKTALEDPLTCPCLTMASARKSHIRVCKNKVSTEGSPPISHMTHSQWPLNWGPRLTPENPQFPKTQGHKPTVTIRGPLPAIPTLCLMAVTTSDTCLRPPERLRNRGRLNVRIHRARNYNPLCLQGRLWFQKKTAQGTKKSIKNLARYVAPNLGLPNTILISKVQKEVLFSCLIIGLPVSSISRPKTAFKKELASTMGCNFAASWFPAFRSPYLRALNQTPGASA